MNPPLQIDVSSLDGPHRQALEEVLGVSLNVDQRLTISVSQKDNSPPQQTAEDWTSIYAGLSDERIEEIDQAIKMRADLFRPID
jgi:hypothetical protein